MLRYSFGRAMGWTTLALLLVMAWDAGGLDLAMARLSGTPSGFALRDNWFLVQVMHEGAKALSWVLVIVLLLGIARPMGFLRRLARSERVQLALAAVASVLVISLIKHGSHTSCPWDLDVFGGVARHVSHWSWGQVDGGPGRCFPAGHASAAFAFLGGYFVLARRMPGVARWWLGCALLSGLLLGLAQQARGAHFMSHTLWSAWLCWTTGLALDYACQWWRARGGLDQAVLTPASSRSSF